ncbi:sulfate transporter protein [Grosmannia clavigera kw1407]|uniref:Sulfate transporter protein n=1 Tax=Grosmannia clavigera (strain kw1407 / UAMH 11150) TaxID=655863 RepID=F0XEP8_GROCL|nr:sulfate transporter protein [Grosmannia clavigera kw1407]EFX04251.1 sulfate transporter protein [Grosmannia clavigera kw1407]
MTWDLARRHEHNVQTLRRSPLAEISGALGDLGTLLPLMTALAVQHSVSLSSTLVFSGLFNVATGIVFGIPLPVQPMKAIAAAAIASRASLRDTVAAGGLVSAAVLLLAATGLLRWLAVHVPVPVGKGIQLGAGLSLIISAGNSLLGPLGWLQPSGLDNRLWALAAFVGLMATQGFRGGRFFPYALVTFLVGLALALAVALTAHAADHNVRLPGFALWRPRVLLPHWLSGEAWGMAVAQLPLTMLNSVVAVSALASDLLGGSTTPASVTALGCSVGLMNLVGCWFGAMPVCHGAGGLAAQYRFGARSGASVILLGLFKTTLGLLLGETLVDLLGFFPRGVLGVLVLASGLELAAVGNSLNQGAPDLWEVAANNVRNEAAAATASDTDTQANRKHRALSDDERLERWTVMLTTTAGILATKNDAVGFAAGLLCHGAYRLADHYRQRWPAGGEGRPLLA